MSIYRTPGRELTDKEREEMRRGPRRLTWVERVLAAYKRKAKERMPTEAPNQKPDCPCCKRNPVSRSVHIVGHGPVCASCWLGAHGLPRIDVLPTEYKPGPLMSHPALSKMPRPSWADEDPEEGTGE